MFRKRNQQSVPTAPASNDVAVSDLLMVVVTTTPYDGSPSYMQAMEYPVAWFIKEHPSHPQPTTQLLDNGDRLSYEVWRFVAITTDGQTVIHWLDHSKGLPVSMRQSSPEEFATVRSALRTQLIIDGPAADNPPVPKHTWGPFQAFSPSNPDNPLADGFAKLTH